MFLQAGRYAKLVGQRVLAESVRIAPARFVLFGVLRGILVALRERGA
jgi:hypothetical protein